MDDGSEGKVDLFGAVPGVMGIVSWVSALIVDAFEPEWDRLFTLLFSIIGFLLGYAIWLVVSVHKQNRMVAIRASRIKVLEKDLNHAIDEHQRLRDGISHFGHLLEAIALNSGKDRIDRAASAYREIFIRRDSREQDVSNRKNT